MLNSGNSVEVKKRTRTLGGPDVELSWLSCLCRLRVASVSNQRVQVYAPVSADIPEDFCNSSGVVVKSPSLEVGVARES